MLFYVEYTFKYVEHGDRSGLWWKAVGGGGYNTQGWDRWTEGKQDRQVVGK